MRIFLLATLLFTAQHSYAVVDLQLGFRWSSYKGTEEVKDFTSNEMVLGAHLEPLPLIPLSLGLTVGLGSYGHDSVDKNKHHGNMEIAVMARGWLPMVPIVTPYGWLRYTLWGNWEYGERGDDTQHGDLAGYLLGIGTKYEFLPLLHAFLELGYGNSTFGQSKKKFEQFLGNTDKVDLTTVNITLGIGAGL